jgi:hypothetical protein
MEFHLLSNTITRNSIERLNLPQFCIIAGEPRASAPPLPLRDYTTHGDATIAAPSRGFHFQQLQPAPKLAPRDEIGRACTSHGTRKFGARGGERERSYRRRGVVAGAGATETTPSPGRRTWRRRRSPGRGPRRRRRGCGRRRRRGPRATRPAAPAGARLRRRRPCARSGSGSGGLRLSVGKRDFEFSKSATARANGPDAGVGFFRLPEDVSST